MRPQEELQLLEKPQFLSKLEDIIMRVVKESCGETKQSFNESTDYQFPFQYRSKYPWGKENNVDSEQVIEEISGIIHQSIEQQLITILNREFISVTTEVKSMREQINDFTTQILGNFETLQNQINAEMEGIRKKNELAQFLHQNPPRFLHSRDQVRLSVNKSSEDQLAKKSAGREIQQIKNTLSQLQQKVQLSAGLELAEKVRHFEEWQKQINMTTKIDIGKLKQSQRNVIEEFDKRCGQMSKNALQNEAKKAVRALMKVYGEDIVNMRRENEKTAGKIESLSHGLQDYVGGQLKSVWMLLNNLKRRIEQLEDKNDIMGQSFIYD